MPQYFLARLTAMPYGPDIEIEFDPAKDLTNREKHGFSLIVGRAVLDNLVAELVDPRHVGEMRMIAFGLVSGRLLVCVCTRRAGQTRIFPVRKANRTEQNRWLGRS